MLVKVKVERLAFGSRCGQNKAFWVLDDALSVARRWQSN